MRAFCQRYGGHGEVARASCRHRDSTLLLQALSVHGHIDFEGLREDSRKRAVDFQSLLDIQREVDIYLNLLELCVIGGVGPAGVGLGRGERSLGAQSSAHAIRIVIPADEAVVGFCRSGGAGGLAGVRVQGFARRSDGAAVFGNIVDRNVALCGPLGGKGDIIGGHSSCARLIVGRFGSPSCEVVTRANRIIMRRNVLTVFNLLGFIHENFPVSAILKGDGVGARRCAECRIVRYILCNVRKGINSAAARLIRSGCPADEGVGMFGIGRFGGHFTVIARTGVIRYTSICFVSIAMAVLRHPRDGVCPRCFAECCIVGHIVGDRREVCFGRTDLPIGLGCPANEGVRVLRIIRFRRVGPIKAWLCVVFYVVIRLERGNTILRLPRDGMARHCDFTGGDGEGDLFRICAAADREGRFAVEGGVVCTVDLRLFDRQRVDRDGVGVGVGIGGYLLSVYRVGRFIFGKRFLIQFPFFHVVFAKGFRRDAGGQGIPDGAVVQTGDDGLGDFCKFYVQLLCIVRIIGKLLTCFCRLRRNFSAQIFTDGNLAPVVRNINFLLRIKSDGIELGMVLYCISRCNCLRKGFRIARITCSMYPIRCIINRQKFPVKTP